MIGAAQSGSWGALTRSLSGWPLNGDRAASFPHAQLLQPRILVFLVANIFPDDFFVAPNGRDEISPRPKFFPCAWLLTLEVSSVGSRKSQTYTATPAEPGELPNGLGTRRNSCILVDCAKRSDRFADLPKRGLQRFLIGRMIDW